MRNLKKWKSTLALALTAAMTITSMPVSAAEKNIEKSETEATIEEATIEEAASEETASEETTVEESETEIESQTETEIETEYSKETQTEDLEISDDIEFKCDGVEPFEIEADDIWGGQKGISMFAENGAGSHESSHNSSTTINLPIRHQAGTNECWAHSVMACMEADLVKNHVADASTINLSENQLAYFARNTATDLLGNDNSDSVVGSGRYYDYGGNSYRAGVRLMNWIGAANESSFGDNRGTVEADMSGKSFTANEGQTHDYIIKDMYFIPTKDKETSDKIDAIKTAVENFNYVEWSYYDDKIYHVNDSGYSGSQSYPYIYTYNATSSTNHSIVIVGWDDNIKKEKFTISGNTPDGNGAWIVRNSWSSSNGDSGYYYISYYDKGLGQGNPASVFTADVASKYDNNYFHGNTSSIGHRSGSKKFAEVFTAKGNEEIKAVSFMLSTDNSNYTIKVYVNDSEVTAAETTGTTTYAGIYTIPLTKPVSVNENDKFKIELNFDDTEYIYYDKSEASSDSNSYIQNTNNCKSGESLVDDSDVSGSTGYNLRINALTQNTGNYTVTFFDADGKTILKTVSLAQNTAPTDSDAPTITPKKGYTSAWDKPFNSTNKSYKVVYTTVLYTVNFMGPNGEVLSSQKVEKGASASYTPSVAGYTFEGWNGDAYKNVQSDVTVSGNFKPIEYPITYVGEVGTHKNPSSYTASGLSLSPAVRAGYIFEGWVLNGQIVTSIPEGKTGPISLSAKWSQSKGFDIRGKEDQIYTGAAIKLKNLVIYYDGLLLTEGKDYKLEYSKNKNIGTAIINVTGIGKYTATETVEFNIKPADISAAEVGSTTVTYKNRNKTPNPTVIFNGKTLEKGTHYTVTDTPATGVTINGKGNFTGSKTVDIKVLAEDEKLLKIADTKIKLSTREYTYSGSECRPTISSITYKGNSLSSSDYMVSYYNNIKAGTAKVIVTGRGDKYTGSKAVEFTIAKKKIADNDFNISGTSQYYAKGGIKPAVTSSRLVLDTDYVIDSYTNSNKIGNATVIIKGKGNYKGTVKKTYEIKKKTINTSNIEIIVPDIVQNSKGTKYKTTPILIDKANGKALEADTDYTFKCTKDLHITIKGKSRYEGEYTTTYKATPGLKSISSATIKQTEKIYYDGTELTADELKRYISVNKDNLRYDKEYTIQASSGNPNYGTCTFWLVGKEDGGYTGVKKFTVKINKRKL